MRYEAEAATSTGPPTPGGVHMAKELFGVFGDVDAFRSLRDEAEFDIVVAGETVTVGVRDGHIGHPGRTDVHRDEDGFCVIWGEAHATGDGGPAAELYEAYVEAGRDGLSVANGSYVAVLEYDGRAFVATDAVRSWECFYVDAGGVRAFGTDLSTVVGVPAALPIDGRAPFEFLHLGTVLGEKTLFEPVRRIPFDGYLAADDVGEFRRFVYDPREFDYVSELSERLWRAIQRRRSFPDRKGILLSAGQDSRSLLAGVPDISHSYTVGWADSQEAAVAQRLATQYGLAHEVLAPDERYLDDRKVLYSQGLRESLHIHHAGYDDAIDAETIYHGLLYDTLLKGYFLERDGADLFGTKVPFQAVDPDVDPVASLLDTLGYLPDGSARLVDCAGDLLREHGLDLDDAPGDPGAFLADSLGAEFEASKRRADSVHNAMDLLMVRNQPTLSFRHHLADNYVEAFVAADTELLEWHRRTPPTHRHPETVHEALADLDDAIFRHRPPSHPRRSNILSQAERFARRKLPLVQSVEPSWPDRTTVYEKYDLDRQLFPDDPAVWELPTRLKLRLDDLRWWLSVRERDP
ncbi:asparagine synthetase B family protein [Halorarum salinum]|uniref:Asparagine synthetase domain-containing protein n=1 Tax=Halorarum salinum TaxID=2743089 RepID=A0A7D5L9A4_9EURY|nr:hypothetical protein [Halobaculum salinum]QLG60695.1 hypothetical protein HUG12_02620 [Halobaculum salinum]